MTLKSGTLIQTGITNCKSVSEKRPTLKRFFTDWFCRGWSSLQPRTTTKSLRSRVNYVAVYITESSHELAFCVCCRHQVRTHQSRQQLFCFVLLVYLSSFFFFSLSLCLRELAFRLHYRYQVQRKVSCCFRTCASTGVGSGGGGLKPGRPDRARRFTLFWNATAELMILCTVWPPITWQHKNDSTGMKYWSNTSTVCTSRYL